MIAQQPPATGNLLCTAAAATTAGVTLLEAVPQGAAPRLLACLSNASAAAGVWIRFDTQNATGGIWLAPGAAILLTWPHCPQGLIRAVADAGTVTVGIVEGR